MEMNDIVFNFVNFNERHDALSSEILKYIMHRIQILPLTMTMITDLLDI